MSPRRRILLVAAVMACMAVAVPSALASHGGPGNGGSQDFATGGGQQGAAHFAFSARQTTGTDARGHINFSSPTISFRADVTCLNVIGNGAFILGTLRPGATGVSPGSTVVAINVRDVGMPNPTGDQFLLEGFTGPEFNTCLSPISGGPITNGNIVVHDGA